MGQDEAPFSGLGQWMAVLFVGLGSAAARAGDVVSWGHVELNTQIRLDTLHREASAGTRTVSEAAGQATRAVLGLHVPPQAWTKNKDTVRSPLACKSPAMHANLGPLHAPPPPAPSNHAPTRVRRLLSLHLYPHSPLETGPLRVPLPTPPPTPHPPTLRPRSRDCAGTEPGPGVGRLGGCAGLRVLLTQLLGTAPLARWGRDGPRDLCPLEGCARLMHASLGRHVRRAPPSLVPGPPLLPAQGPPSNPFLGYQEIHSLPDFSAMPKR